MTDTLFSTLCCSTRYRIPCSVPGNCQKIFPFSLKHDPMTDEEMEERKNHIDSYTKGITVL